MKRAEEIKQAYLQGRLDRREFITLMLKLGVSLPVAGAFLAAHGPLQAVQKAFAGAAPAGSQDFVIAGAKEAIGFDPVQHNDADSTYIQGLIHDSVAIIDPQFNVKPHLAETWTVSTDNLTYVYKFRKGVKFQDGTEMTADDVIFSIDRILANKYREGGKYQKISMISSHRKVDDRTVEIKLKFVYAPFAAAFGNMYVVPKAHVQRVGDEEFTKKPVGAGPFKFVEWVPNNRVRLEAFADYWLARPKLARVTVRPISENAVAVANLLSGDVDAINDIVGPNLVVLQRNVDKVKVLNKTSLSYFWAGFRMIGRPYTDLRFRQAIYMATDFDAAIQAVFPAAIGVRAYGTIPPGLWPRDDTFLKGIAPKQNKGRAKELFDELIKEGVMASDFKILVAPPPDDARIRIGEIMVTDLKQLGLNAELWRGDWAAHSDITLQTNFSLIYMLGTIAAIPDPDANIRWLFGSQGGHSTYLNLKIEPGYKALDDRINRAQESKSRDERERIYREVQRHVLRQVYHIPLYHKNVIMAARTHVKDFDVSQSFSTWNVVKPWANVYMEGKK